jgi:hypothetical protein
LMRKKLSAKWMCARTSGTPPRDSRSSNSGMSWSAPLPSTAPPALARTAAAAHSRRRSSLDQRGGCVRAHGAAGSNDCACAQWQRARLHLGQVRESRGEVELLRRRNACGE